MDGTRASERPGTALDNASLLGELEWLTKPIRDVAANFDVDLEGSWRLILASLAAAADASLAAGADSLLPDAAGINFGTAALYLQSSTQVYSKKVDYVHSQVVDVLSYISGSRPGDAGAKRIYKARGPRDAQMVVEEDEHYGDDGSDDEEGRGRAQPKHFALAAVPATAADNAALFSSRMPMSLMPLEDFEKMNIPIQPKGRTELIGKRDDFAMNGCDVDGVSGALLLDIDNQPLINCSEGYLDPEVAESEEEEMDVGTEEHDGSIEAGRRATAAEATRPSMTTAEAPRGSLSALKHSDAPTRASARLSELRSAQAVAAADVSLGSDGEEEEDAELDPWADAASLGIRTHKPKKGRHHRLPSGLWKRLSTKRRREEENGTSAGVYYTGRDEPLLPLGAFLFPSRRALAALPSTHAPYVPPALEEPLYAEYRRRAERRRAAARPPPRRRPTADQAAPLEEDDADAAEEVDISIEGGWGGEEGGLALGDDDFAGLPSQGDPSKSLARAMSLGYEHLVEFHCSKYFQQANAKLKLTDVTKRVQAWEARVGPLLAIEEARRDFRIHEYGTEILDRFPDIGAQNQFVQLTGGLEQWEIPRYFLSSLMMANTRNVEVGERRRQKSDPLDVIVDTMSLKLLTTERHHETFEN